jgi:hypothetical protein
LRHILILCDEELLASRPNPSWIATPCWLSATVSRYIRKLAPYLVAVSSIGIKKFREDEF